MASNANGLPPYPFDDAQAPFPVDDESHKSSSYDEVPTTRLSGSDEADEGVYETPSLGKQDDATDGFHTIPQDNMDDKDPFASFSSSSPSEPITEIRSFPQTRFEETPAPVPTPTPTPTPRVTSRGGTSNKGGASNVKSVLMGVAGGAVSAALVTALLNVIPMGAKTTSLTTSTTTTTTDSPAGQVISIDSAGQDATVSQVVSAKALPSVVAVHVTTSSATGLGSGVILDTDGNILTNYHVVEGGESISVTIGSKSYDATLVGTDASSDLAVIKADLAGDSVTPIEVGDSDALVVGDWVMTIGSPFGLDQSVSAGIVSSLSRNTLMESTAGNTLYTNLIQTDAAINPGNSGGALVNDQGQLVGISTLYSSSTESFAGVGFAIPGNYAVEIANKIIAGETVTHAYIGLTMQTVNAQNAQANNLTVTQGAYIAEVTKGGPAEQAGLKEGDIITSLDGEEITSSGGMILAVRSHKIGETVEIGFVRDGKAMTAQVTFGDDAELQKKQQEELQQRQQQQQQQQYNPFGQQNDGYGYNDYGYNGYDGYDGYFGYEDIWNLLFNDRGGSYTLSE